MRRHSLAIQRSRERSYESKHGLRGTGPVPRSDIDCTYPSPGALTRIAFAADDRQASHTCAVLQDTATNLRDVSSWWVQLVLIAVTLTRRAVGTGSDSSEPNCVAGAAPRSDRTPRISFERCKLSERQADAAATMQSRPFDRYRSTSTRHRAHAARTSRKPLATVVFRRKRHPVRY